MSSPRKDIDFERLGLSVSGTRAAFSAYELLLQEWRSGSRDREVGLHLMFLAWYLLCEPGHLTGLDESALTAVRPADVFNEVHSYFERTIRTDAEMLYVVGLMARLFPYLLGDEATFEALGWEYRGFYRGLAPEGLSPDIFAGRGAYGEYFAGQSRVVNGY